MQKIAIVLAILIIFIIGVGIIYLKFGPANSNNIEPIKISGSAMSPNYTDGQFWVVDKVIYTTTNPQRGDVVLFKDVTDPNKVFAKRIIGLPGEEIEIKNGGVYINGQIISEAYLSKDLVTNPGDYPSLNQKIIPQGSYFILGDNRTGSFDSRNFGFVLKENIIGKLTTCYKNCNK